MTETIDKLYLELSHVTAARNEREINMAIMIRRLCRAISDRKDIPIIGKATGLLARYGMDASNWCDLMRGDSEERTGS